MEQFNLDLYCPVCGHGQLICRESFTLRSVTHEIYTCNHCGHRSEEVFEEVYDRMKDPGYLEKCRECGKDYNLAARMEFEDWENEQYI